MNEQLTEYFENNKLLTEHQHGFRKNNSTTYLTLDMFDKIFDSKCNGKIYMAFFPSDIDFQSHYMSIESWLKVMFASSSPLEFIPVVIYNDKH